ncbi:hypothetical protein TCAL_14837 [Tigriopus californicus]|uniref:Uncharacterized protein n=1 Tax=Tigriopus californicus TaxID=6832 RepID=A0A553PPD2_TIGCA|nr:hypothetical protein TCAL_14837 [Tigriopus californicus]
MLALDMEQEAQVNQIAGPYSKVGHRAQNERSSTQGCGWCGLTRPRGRPNCPARGKTCNKCQKAGNFALICHSAPENAEPAAYSNVLLVSGTSARAAAAKIHIGGTRILAIVYTGAQSKVVQLRLLPSAVSRSAALTPISIRPFGQDPIQLTSTLTGPKFWNGNQTTSSWLTS